MLIEFQTCILNLSISVDGHFTKKKTKKCRIAGDLEIWHIFGFLCRAKCVCACVWLDLAGTITIKYYICMCGAGVFCSVLFSSVFVLYYFPFFFGGASMAATFLGNPPFYYHSFFSASFSSYSTTPLWLAMGFDFSYFYA